jgi:hypothetical protein
LEVIISIRLGLEIRYLADGADLSRDTWKTGCTEEDSDNSSLYTIKPILEMILKGLKYLNESFW